MRLCSSVSLRPVSSTVTCSSKSVTSFFTARLLVLSHGLKLKRSSPECPVWWLFVFSEPWLGCQVFTWSLRCLSMLRAGNPFLARYLCKCSDFFEESIFCNSLLFFWEKVSPFQGSMEADYFDIPQSSGFRQRCYCGPLLVSDMDILQLIPARILAG